MKKTPFVTKEQIEEIAKTYPTPFHIYDEKGIRESLVLVDQLAFIVNIPNNTVVTAMQQNETDENIFTNIDGAVII